MDEPAMKGLVVANEGPYGSERAYNALRTVSALGRKAGAAVDVFLAGDGVQWAARQQATPDGSYNVERMLQAIPPKDRVFVRATCAKARGLGPDNLIQGVSQGCVDIHADLVLSADRVLVL